MSEYIIIEEDAKEVGLAQMVADLIRQNIEAKHEKRRYLERIEGKISITAKDAGVSVTLRFTKGKLIVSGKDEPDANVRITTDSQTILDLSSIKIICGIPWFFSSTGLRIIKKMLTGELRIKGMFFNLLTILNLMKLFSVM